jgi:hypothetical protein
MCPLKLLLNYSSYGSSVRTTTNPSLDSADERSERLSHNRVGQPAREQRIRNMPEEFPWP